MMRSKQMDCEINLHQFTFNRLLKIAETATPPETDLGNIQLAVLHLLDVDPELKALTSNLFNLGFDISAFNTQKRVWDVLNVDSPVYLPNRARVKVILKTKEKVVLASPVASRRRRDPRRKTPATIFQRDPRRKGGRVESPLLKENDQPAVEVEEPNHNDEEGNRSDEPGQSGKQDDSREKEKIDEPQTPAEIVDNDVVEEEESAQPESQLQILKALPLPREPETEEQAKKVVCINLESESSDEERLHIAIDESFEEVVLPEPAPTKEGGLVEETLAENSELCDLGSSAGNNGKTIGAGAAAESKKEEEEEVVIVAEKKQPPKYQLLLKTPAMAEKSREQLEVERQLLMKLVEEREMLKATLEEAGIPHHQLQMNFDEVEEGELSVSYDEDIGQDEEDPSSRLSNPTKAVSEGIDLPEPIENRFIKYWDDFPDDDDWQPKC